MASSRRRRQACSECRRAGSICRRSTWRFEGDCPSSFRLSQRCCFARCFGGEAGGGGVVVESFSGALVQLAHREADVSRRSRLLCCGAARAVTPVRRLYLAEQNRRGCTVHAGKPSSGWKGCKRFLVLRRSLASSGGCRAGLFAQAAPAAVVDVGGIHAMLTVRRHRRQIASSPASGNRGRPSFFAGRASAAAVSVRAG